MPYLLSIDSGALLVVASLATAYFWEGIGVYQKMKQYYAGNLVLHTRSVITDQRQEEEENAESH